MINSLPAIWAKSNISTAAPIPTVPTVESGFNIAPRIAQAPVATNFYSLVTGEYYSMRYHFIRPDDNTWEYFHHEPQGNFTIPLPGLWNVRQDIEFINGTFATTVLTVDVSKPPFAMDPRDTVLFLYDFPQSASWGTPVENVEPNYSLFPSRLSGFGVTMDGYGSARYTGASGSWNIINSFGTNNETGELISHAGGSWKFSANVMITNPTTFNTGFLSMRFTDENQGVDIVDIYGYLERQFDGTYNITVGNGELTATINSQSILTPNSTLNCQLIIRNHTDLSLTVNNQTVNLSLAGYTAKIQTLTGVTITGLKAIMNSRVTGLALTAINAPAVPRY